VQLVAVDEPAGGDVPDLGVVLPAVPEPAHDLDVVGGLVEVLGEALLSGLGPVLQADRREGAASEVVGLVRAGGDLHPQARAAGADVVEGGDRLGYVERLGVRGHHRRHQADVAGERRDPGRDEHGVEAAADLVGAAVQLAVVRGLQAEAVLEGDEVEQAALGLGDQVGPVRGGEQVAGPGHRLPPGGGVPAGAVEGDGEMQGGEVDDTVGAFLEIRTRSPARWTWGHGGWGNGSGATERAGRAQQVDVLPRGESHVEDGRATHVLFLPDRRRQSDLCAG
jgi:hypothetical protein